ncbi:MAG TPA: YciI family protein [Terriglobales bacterium]|nr:YciI family protein [Terriglobales bacterium]
MRVMMIVKASKDSEAGKMPEEAMMAEMGKYNEQLVNAGVLEDAAGLKASSNGARIKFAKDGKVSVIDGPFPETKELIAGFWVIKVKSFQEAIDWAKKAPNPHGRGAETAIAPAFLRNGRLRREPGSRQRTQAGKENRFAEAKEVNNTL